MSIMLDENIKRFRKERGLTQEQLAEALGVTVGAVYKWENGRSTPEISMLLQLADLFGVSLDALVGFEAQNGSAAALDERIFELQRQKKYSDAITEAEKALLRYPNNFYIVYRAGSLYGVAGGEQNNHKYLRRAIELLERTITLLEQNTSPEISEAVIRGDIAQHYIVLGNVEKGVEILKKYNIKGIYNPILALAYTVSDYFRINPSGDIKEAEPYLSGSFFNIMNTSAMTMLAYGSYYYHAGDYARGCEAYLWLANILESMKVDKNAVACVDKIIALSYCDAAAHSLLLGETKKAEEYLRLSYTVAKRFDQKPIYDITNLKFCVGDLGKAVAYDTLGKSAIALIEENIAANGMTDTLGAIWQKIKNETNGGAQ